MKFTREQAARLTGIPTDTLGSLYRAGMLPAVGGFSAQQVLALAVSRALRLRGCSMEDCHAALMYFWGLSAEHFEAALARQSRYVGVFGVQVLPRLITREEAT